MQNHVPIHRICFVFFFYFVCARSYYIFLFFLLGFFFFQQIVQFRFYVNSIPKQGEFRSFESSLLNVSHSYGDTKQQIFSQIQSSCTLRLFGGMCVCRVHWVFRMTKTSFFFLSIGSQYSVPAYHDSSPIGAFCNQRSWIKLYKLSLTATL